MSFFKNLFKMDSSASTPNDTKEQAQRRLHQRYPLNVSSLFVCESDLLGTLPVSNISHFGCFASVENPEALSTSVSLPTMANLRVAGLCKPLEIVKILPRAGGVGIAFRHGSIDDFHAMRDLMAPIHWGYTAVAIGESTLADGGVHSKFRGEGPFDLVLERQASGAIKNILLTFLTPGGVYASVSFDGIDLVTSWAIDQVGVGSRMEQTTKVDESLVRMGIIALLGIPQAFGQECASMLFQHLK
jgi:hypothetical protein